MLRVEEALEMCLATDVPKREEICALRDARGRWLTRPLYAARDSPPADMSAMDGVAVRSADLVGADTIPDDCFIQPAGEEAPRRRLRVLETVAAGHIPTRRVESGTASWVMTGGVVPPGADTVVMREYVTSDGAFVEVPLGAPADRHIRRQAEEFAEGAPLLSAGTRLDAGALTLAASQGLADVWVARKPIVAIVATGDELRRPTEPCNPAEIYGSNTTALMALVAEAGGHPIDAGIARDTLESTRSALRHALSHHPDLILTTGGVSVGDFDVVRQALADEGAQMRFWKVRMKPGKPLAMGVLGGVPAVGLPGNPVSCQLGFWQFVRPLIRRALGDPRPFLPVVPATLVEPIRKRPGRAQFVLVSLTLSAAGRWSANPAVSASSGRVGAMAHADGFALLDYDAVRADPGDTVQVQLLTSDLPGATTPQFPWSGRP